ncbi:MAG TPA: RusA family crossover junction endodeoxyribonuclease [Gemmatimonadaceae bacterium]|nr:RusA family crossover junction endodeoxyribonuclease [Gemmatimonadaceae bacterium]
MTVAVSGLTDEQIRRQLSDQGWPAAAIERAIAGQHAPRRSPGAPTPVPPPAGAVTLVLPWSCLISDNRHRGPVSSRADAAAYKLARTRAHAEAAEQWGPRAPFSGRIALVARIFPPNAQRRDVGNFAKCVKDALSGVAYADDVQVVDERWIKAAIDVDRPRAEILIEELQ